MLPFFADKNNYDDMHAHFAYRIQKVMKLSLSQSFEMATGMIKACKEAFPSFQNDLRVQYLEAVEDENNKGYEPQDGNFEIYLLEFRQ